MLGIVIALANPLGFNWKREKGRNHSVDAREGDAGERNLLSPENSMMLLIPAAQTLTPSGTSRTFLTCCFGISNLFDKP